jgi:hypothetical protein
LDFTISVEEQPPEEYRELRASVEPSWFGRAAATTSVRMTWVPNPAAAADDWQRTSIRAYYTVHYSEPEGFDCGIHCEPNPHMEGLLHYQERTDGGYSYEPVSVGARSVSGLLWELLDGLADQPDS